MTKILYVSDLDGTLLDGDARLSEVTVELLNEALGVGTLFTVATARTPATVDPLLRRLHPKRLPAIVMTGAALWDFERQEYVEPRFIGPDATGEIDDAFAAEGLTPFVYALSEPAMLDVYHSAGTLTRPEQRFYDDRRSLTLKRFHLRTPLPESARTSAILYFAMGPVEKTVAVARRLKDDGRVSVSDYRDTYIPDLGLIEIFGRGVSKSSAVRALASRIGADRTVVFGDNLNDIDMMKSADTSVAVGNALPAVKAVADEIIGRNTESAVARYVQKKSLS